jgi:hypothetical protein
MSSPRRPQPAKVLVSLLFRRGSADDLPPWLDTALARLRTLLGPVDYSGELRTFNESSYYAAELGEAPGRVFLAFAPLMERDQLAGLKLATNAIEDELRDEGGRRTVNLDPGLLSPENLVLATGKNRGHRIYLGQGLFAEVTLLFQGGGYQPLPWSYPDYAAPWCGEMLLHLRKILLRQLSGTSSSSLEP